VRALRTITRRLGGGQPVGLGGPWDVRVQEVDTSGVLRGNRQDASRDVAAVLLVDCDEHEWLRHWPGDVHDVVLAIPAARLAAHVDRLGEDGVAAWLERTGARWVVLDDGTAAVPDAFASSHRYLHHGGAPVVLGATGPALLGLDDDAATIASANACCWLRCDLRGRDAAAGTGDLQRAYDRVVAERATRPELPTVGSELVPGATAKHAAIDDITRDGDAIRRISGWAFVDSTGSPPAYQCLAEAMADGRLVVRECTPFARLERPDVAAAFTRPGALFAGLRIDVPADIGRIGAALRVLISDREAGDWQLLELR
jgi:hypothetical protein